jgi:zinc transporter 1/2/3
MKGFVHMFPEADKNLSSSCLPPEWHDHYSAFSGLFAMIAVLVVQLIQTLANRHFQTQLGAKKIEPDTESPTSIEDAPMTADGCAMHAVDNNGTQTITTLILEAGVALHSFIIGISLGVTGGTEFGSLLTAICFHQFFEGFALSVSGTLHSLTNHNL